MRCRKNRKQRTGLLDILILILNLVRVLLWLWLRLWLRLRLRLWLRICHLLFVDILQPPFSSRIR